MVGLQRTIWLLKVLEHQRVRELKNLHSNWLKNGSKPIILLLLNLMEKCLKRYSRNLLYTIQHCCLTNLFYVLQYDIESLNSEAGGGGEYEVQEGFGWTNGVILDLLLSYGDRLTAPSVSSDYD